MSALDGRILKRSKVAMSGPRRLNVSGSAAGGSSSVPVQGRIIEQNADGAVVEVTCGCGNVFQLHCAYAPVPG
ncbi:MAG: hypothetical protein GY794_10170 [bacterium]|nr:hypothetical protein [bacterium]